MQRFAKKSGWVVLILAGILILAACSPVADDPTSLPVGITATLAPEKTPVPTETKAAFPTNTVVEADPINLTAFPTKEVGNNMADVRSVTASGDENRYQFAVEVRSPDTGCEQYADWWEVVSEDGELLYRRILAHSHVSEQPFTRAGGPVAIDADTSVIVRAHMHPGGYGGAALRGSVSAGFEAIQLAPDFAIHLNQIEPLPSGCGF